MNTSSDDIIDVDLEAAVLCGSIDETLLRLSDRAPINPQESVTADDLLRARNNNRRPLTEADINPEIRNLFNEQLAKYNNKYGSNLTFDSINSYLEFSIAANKDQQKVKELITNELISNTSTYIIIKSILVVASLIDKFLDNIQRKQYTDDVNDILLFSIDRIFSYVEKFEEIKERYKIHDLDGAISRVVTDVKSTAPSKEQEEDINKILELLKTAPNNA